MAERVEHLDMVGVRDNDPMRRCGETVDARRTSGRPAPGVRPRRAAVNGSVRLQPITGHHERVRIEELQIAVVARSRRLKRLKRAEAVSVRESPDDDLPAG